MIGVGFVLAALAAWGLWLARRRRLERSSLFLKLAIAAIALPLIANTTGWMLTEMGRQPWVVWGLYKTSDAVSPSVGAWSVGLTLAGFTLLYGVLAAIETWLLVHVARRGPEPLAAAPSAEEGGRLPYMAY
jgi:cytochrome d ubiquinol oxidase subunit I